MESTLIKVEAPNPPPNGENILTTLQRKHNAYRPPAKQYTPYKLPTAQKKGVRQDPFQLKRKNAPIQKQDEEENTPGDGVIGKLVVAFTGGVNGGGETQDHNTSSSTTSTIVNRAEASASEHGIPFEGLVIQSGFYEDPTVDNAYDFIIDHYDIGDVIVLYGYSYGGKQVVTLAERLEAADIPVLLMITVDAADGPALGTSVDRTVPDNVQINANEYQVTNSRIGSRGDANSADDPQSTSVYNLNLTPEVEGVNHGNIDEAALNYNAYLINRAMGISGGEVPSFGFESTNSDSSEPSSVSDSSSDSGSRTSSEGTSDTGSGSGSSSSYEEDNSSSSN